MNTMFDGPQKQQPIPPIFTDSELIKLEIKPSSIPGGGMGLFATRPIRKGQYIAEYYGAIMQSKYSFSQPFLMEDKMVYIDQQHSVISRSPASRANDIVKWDPQGYFNQQSLESEYLRRNRIMPTLQGKIRNASISLPSKNKAFLAAERNILPGQQIYIDYGYEYWEFFMKAALQAKGK